MTVNNRMQFNLTAARSLKLNVTDSQDGTKMPAVKHFRVETSRTGQKQYTIIYKSGVVQ
jgi:hypothetical protein